MQKLGINKYTDRQRQTDTYRQKLFSLMFRSKHFIPFRFTTCTSGPCTPQWVGCCALNSKHSIWYTDLCSKPPCMRSHHQHYLLCAANGTISRGSLRQRVNSHLLHCLVLTNIHVWVTICLVKQLNLLLYFARRCRETYTNGNAKTCESVLRRRKASLRRA